MQSHRNGLLPGQTGRPGRTDKMVFELSSVIRNAAAARPYPGGIRINEVLAVDTFDNDSALARRVLLASGLAPLTSEDGTVDWVTKRGRWALDLPLDVITDILDHCRPV